MGQAESGGWGWSRPPPRTHRESCHPRPEERGAAVTPTPACGGRAQPGTRYGSPAGQGLPAPRHPRPPPPARRRLPPRSAARCCGSFPRGAGCLRGGRSCLPFYFPPPVLFCGWLFFPSSSFLNCHFKPPFFRPGTASPRTHPAYPPSAPQPDNAGPGGEEGAAARPPYATAPRAAAAPPQYL